MMRHIQQARTKAKDSKTGVEPAWLQEIGLPKLPPKKLPKPFENTDDVAPTKSLMRRSSNEKEKTKNVKDKTIVKENKTKDVKKSDSDNEDAKPSQEAVYAQQELLYKFDFNLENLKLVRKEKGKVPEVSVDIKLNHSSDDDHPLARFDDGMIHPCKQITVREYKDLVLHGGKDGAKPSRKVWTGLHSKRGDVYVGHREDWGPLIIIVHGGRYKVSTRADAFNSSVSETRKNS
jgi:hypothetical protein